MPASVIFVSYLIKTARLRAALRPNSWIVEFNHKTELQDRIKRLLDSWNEKPTGKSCRITNSLMTAMLVIVTLILPTLITLEPNAGIPDEIIGNDAFILTSENAYLVLNSEGKYEVYADGEYKFTSSWILESSLHIYNEEGVLIK